jgi:TolB-like protein/Tfp pilus assembly protein PilF
LDIAVALQVELTTGEQARIITTDNLDAWRYMNKGAGIFLKFSKEAMVKSREFFEKALEIDPEYAGAVTSLAWTHFMDARYGYTNSRKVSFKRAVELAKKSVALDDNQPMVHSLLQFIYLIQKQYDKAIEEGKKAIALGPNNAQAHIIHGDTLYRSGIFEESVQMCEKAIRLQPHAPLYYFMNLCTAYYWVGRYEESLALAEQLIERSRKTGFRTGERWGYWGSARAHVRLGRESEAREDVAKFLKIVPGYNLDLDRRNTLYKPALIEQEHDDMRKVGFPEHEPLPLPDKPSIAVLPFVNMSDDPKQEYFSDGITEEIITALSKTPKLFVIARTSSFKYKGKEVDVRTVGRELGVRYVLEGSVRKSKDRLRITAQLIDAKTGNHLWAERYDRERKDIFALQDEITLKVLTGLQVKLTEGDQALILGKKLKNLDVYLKYLEATAHFRKGTRESVTRYSQLGQEIIDMAPETAVGYQMLAWYYWYLCRTGTSPRESAAKAFKLAKKTLDMDKSDSRAHALLGSVYLLMRQHEKAIDSGKQAVALNPNGAFEHDSLGSTLTYAGRLDEAIDHLKRAIRLNPFPDYWYFQHLGVCYMLKGQYEEALTEFKKALHRAPDAPVNRVSLAVIYILLDRQEEARAVARKVLDIRPNFSVERVSKTMPFKNQADLKLVVDAMRKAGLG